MFHWKKQHPTTQQLAIYSDQPDGPGSSKILRNKATPFGQPLRKSSHASVETTLDLIEFRATRDTNSFFMGTREFPGKGNYQWTTYQQSLDESFACASGLALLGLKPGDIVGVHMNNCPQWATTSFACAKGSFVVSTIYPSFSKMEIPGILNTCDSQVVVCGARLLGNIVGAKDSSPTLTHAIVVGPIDSELQRQAHEKGLKCLSWQEVVQIGKSSPQTLTRPTPDQVALVCFTSGTTGAPKGAVLTHANVVAGVSSAEEHFKDILMPDWAYLSYLPLSHSFDQVNFWSCSNLGMRVAFLSGDGITIFSDLSACGASYFPSVPRVLSKFHAAIKNKVASSSWIQRQLYRWGLSAKMRLQGTVTQDTIWDKLIFQKIRAAMGDKVRIVICGSAPVGESVF
jgi:long-chain acyl-CoA synthetase